MARALPEIFGNHEQAGVRTLGRRDADWHSGRGRNSGDLTSGKGDGLAQRKAQLGLGGQSNFFLAGSGGDCRPAPSSD